jgi:hypothetical protein
MTFTESRTTSWRKEGKKHLRSIAVYSTLGKDLQEFIFGSASVDSKVTLQLKESVVARVPLLSRTSGLLYQMRSNVQKKSVGNHVFGTRRHFTVQVDAKPISLTPDHEFRT